MLNSTKKKDYKPVWVEVFNLFMEKYPSVLKNIKKITTKYNTEKGRYRAYQQVVNYSSVSINPNSKLPNATRLT